MWSTLYADLNNMFFSLKALNNFSRNLSRTFVECRALIKFLALEWWHDGAKIDASIVLDAKYVNKIKICSDDGRDEGQQLKPIGTEASFGTTVITATILFIISIFSSRVTVNVLVFVLRVVFFSSNCVYRDAIHVRCCASGFCIISKFCARVFWWQRGDDKRR